MQVGVKASVIRSKCRRLKILKVFKMNFKVSKMNFSGFLTRMGLILRKCNTLNKLLNKGFSCTKA